MSNEAKIVENFGAIVYQRMSGMSWGEVAQGLGVTEVEVFNATVKFNEEYLSVTEKVNANVLSELKGKYMLAAQELVGAKVLKEEVQMKLMDGVGRYLRAQMVYEAKMKINARMTGQSGNKPSEKPSTKPKEMPTPRAKTYEEEAYEFIEAMMKSTQELDERNERLDREMASRQQQ